MIWYKNVDMLGVHTHNDMLNSPLPLIITPHIIHRIYIVKGNKWFYGRSYIML